MTKLLSITILAAFLMIGGIAAASAHCGKCGDRHAKTEKMQPCEKGVKSGKKCHCNKKKPCQKKVSSEKKPCTKCAGKKQRAKLTTGTKVKSNIGSLTIQSRGPVKSNYN